MAVLGAVILFLESGCAPTYHQYRMQGRRALGAGDYAVAYGLFRDAEPLVPSDPKNLHDLALCSEHIAREQLELRNPMAAMRELDRAVDYYERAITSAPGMQAALEGKSRVLALKGRIEEGLRNAHWASVNVGPSARQQIFLARELEARGDLDTALLHYRQAVIMEPNSNDAHEALAAFLDRHGLPAQPTSPPIGSPPP